MLLEMISFYLILGIKFINASFLKGWPLSAIMLLGTPNLYMMWIQMKSNRVGVVKSVIGIASPHLER